MRSKAGISSGDASRFIPPVLSSGAEPRKSESGLQTSAAKKIEAALRRLKPGDSIFVETTGKIHTVKDRFVSGEAEPLVSFTACSDGTFSVFSGIPPRNQTVVIAGEPFERITPLHRGIAPEPLQYDKVYRGGDTLQLGEEFLVRLPHSASITPGMGGHVEQALMGSKAGDVLYLGRRDFQIEDGTVSRVHATVRVLRNQVMPDGSRDFLVQINPGIRARKDVYVQHAADVPEVVQGKRTCPGGASILLGPLGTVSIPHPTQSPEDLSHRLSEMIARGADLEHAQGLLNTFMPSMYGEDLAFSRGVHTLDRGELDVRGKFKVLALQAHIVGALHLIKDGRYSEAIGVLSESTALELVGYRFEQNHQFPLDKLTEQAVLENLRRVASDSWFRHGRNVVYPSTGVLADGVEPLNEEERDLLRRWDKELALIYAEEWTHALQQLLGGGVSRKAALIDHFETYWDEADVAAFFFENGVRLSDLFVKNRYDVREKALAIVRGFQTQEDQDLFVAGVHLTRPGETLFLGRNVESRRPDVRGVSIRRAEDSVAGGAERNQARQQLRSIECTITPKSGGGYEIAPYTLPSGKPATVFVPDQRGYYSRLQGPVFLPPGAPFYVGRGFKFVLPS